MKYIEVIASTGSTDTIQAIAEKVKAHDVHFSADDGAGMRQMRLLVNDESLQQALDALQHVLGAQPTARVIVLPVEATLPKPEKSVDKSASVQATARESLYAEVEKGSRLDSNYLLLVILSTVVAAIGLIENNIAVVIGAMVIAPLLGPNLALSLGTALGDTELMRISVKALSAGIFLAFFMSLIFGFFWPGALDSEELMSRTYAGLDSIALALASGAAASLSLTTGLSGVLVGVMVAVALLPPTVTAGLMLGSADYQLAVGALLLLAINIVCVNLSSKLVFFFKGVRPRTWGEKEKASRAMRQYIIGWVVTLILLLVLVYIRKLN